VDDVDAAWQAFREFLTVLMDGLESDPDADADGWIVQWGRHSWHDNVPSLAFTRQFAVDTRETWTESDRHQPEHWQVSLDLVFADEPTLADLDRFDVRDTGFDFSPPGPAQDAALGEVERAVARHPTLRELWAGTPTRSAVAMERAG
jgi:hypothetical protein